MLLMRIGQRHESLFQKCYKMEELARPELVSTIKPLRLQGLRRRLLLILFNNRRWLSSTEIRRHIAEAYKNGTVDHNYKFNRVCIELRDLEVDGLIDKRVSKHVHGRESRYIINVYGIEQLAKSLKTDNNNNSQV